MQGDQWLALAGILASILVGAWGGVLTYRATRSKIGADREQGAGVLALELVRELRLELTEVKTELRNTKETHGIEMDEVKDEINNIREVWWPQHEEWDKAVEEILRQLEPDLISKLPRRIPMP